MLLYGASIILQRLFLLRFLLYNRCTVCHTHTPISGKNRKGVNILDGKRRKESIWNEQKGGQLYEPRRRDQSWFKHEQGTSDQNVYTNWSTAPFTLYLVLYSKKITCQYPNPWEGIWNLARLSMSIHKWSSTETAFSLKR